jgi:hypothetical protein
MIACAHRLSVLCVTGLLLAACTPAVRLSDADRASLKAQPAIHVLHYASPLPAVKTGNKTAAPSPAEIRKAAGADPAALVATGFSRLLGKKEKLRNLRLDSGQLPRPVPDNAAVHRNNKRNGLAFEVWVKHWGFEPANGKPGHVAIQLDARSRLTHLNDRRVLWSAGQCRLGNSRSQAITLPAADLGKPARLRKQLSLARDECARQLLRDFDTRTDAKK